MNGGGRYLAVLADACPRCFETSSSSASRILRPGIHHVSLADQIGALRGHRGANR